MISVEELSIEFGVKPLFKNASFVINNRERIALVGKNGAGKSTLLKVLSGLQTPTSGRVIVPNETTIGYLPQVMKLHDDTTVRQEARKAFASFTKLQSKLISLEKQLSERNDYDSSSYLQLVEDYTSLHEYIQTHGGDSFETTIERTLLGLGFVNTDFERPTNEFSGGWRMRIELAKILLQRPDVMLLDEPTNHLDIESIAWLEQFLRQSGSSVVVVSHDRTFIDNVTNRTLEISCGRIVDYKVKYSDFVRLRGERREQQLRAWENQQKEIADIKSFIERFRYKPTKAVQVQSRIKQLERIVPIEVDEVETSSMKLRFPPCQRSGDFPVICDNVTKSYGSHLVFSDVNFTLKRGEKVAFVGKNGEGKSTLVKSIMGEIPYDGNIKVGHNVQIGYFAQNQSQLLNEQLTIYDTVDRAARGDMRLRINDLLGAFMFGGELADKRISVLSGGERNRLSMLLLLLEPVNLLILDEPTNHLDMHSKDILKEALLKFDGTIIVVSHDRDFLDGLVSKVYEFGGGRVKEHLGGIFDFMQSKNIDNLHLLEKKENNTKHGVDNESLVKLPKETSGKADYEQQKERQRKRSKLEKEIGTVELQIADVEQKLSELNAKLLLPENSSNMQLVEEYTRLKEKNDILVSEWEKLNIEKESI